MDNNFRIRFIIKTLDGFEPLCDFYIGRNRHIAHALYHQLAGSVEVLEGDVLQIDFVEMNNGLPVNVKIKNCTLLEMSGNCSLIAKEIFKHRNLEGMF
jgi:hypothetical protein